MMDGLLMFESVTLEISRKLFLASRNPLPNQAETCGMWRVTKASLFASTLFFTAQFFPKRNF